VYPWLPRVFSDAARAGHEVRVVLEATGAPIAALREGAIDLAVLCEKPASRALHATAVFEDALVAVVAASHPLAKRPRISAKDLAAERLLVYDVPLERLDVWRRFLRPAGARPREVARVPITEAIVELARAGHGVGVLADWAIHHYGARGVVPVPLGAGGLRRTWFGVRRASDPNRARIDAVTASIAQAAAHRARRPQAP
jgi:LysR family transcriptional regulator for metE and metH